MSNNFERRKLTTATNENEILLTGQKCKIYGLKFEFVRFLLLQTTQATGFLCTAKTHQSAKTVA